MRNLRELKSNFKEICVVGFKRSGVALCKLALSLGKKVKVTEINPFGVFYKPYIDNFSNQGVKFEFGGHTKKFIKSSDLIVLSPGVYTENSAVMTLAKELGTLVVGELEFASWFSKGKIIAITGTNGKTTTTFLTYLVLKSKHKSSYLAGNIGVPFSSIALNTEKNSISVLEVSSYQLETIIEFKPYVSCITNLQPDHLDRYKNFSEYVRAKMNIFKNQKKTDYAVINKNISSGIDRKSIKAGIRYFDNEFGNENFSAAAAIASVFEVTKPACQRIFSSFKGLSHRMQVVNEINGITFINDSKATNPSSTAWALKNIEDSVILIAGGKDKGLDYSEIKPFLKNVKKINLFGQAREKINRSLSFHKNIEMFFDLEKAVISSFKEAEEKDVILFSPMCSSFDMFSSYIERGNFFVSKVKELSLNSQKLTGKMHLKNT